MLRLTRAEIAQGHNAKLGKNGTAYITYLDRVFYFRGMYLDCRQNPNRVIFEYCTSALAGGLTIPTDAETIELDVTEDFPIKYAPHPEGKALVMVTRPEAPPAPVRTYMEERSNLHLKKFPHSITYEEIDFTFEKYLQSADGTYKGNRYISLEGHVLNIYDR